MEPSKLSVRPRRIIAVATAKHEVLRVVVCQTYLNFIKQLTVVDGVLLKGIRVMIII